MDTARQFRVTGNYPPLVEVTRGSVVDAIHCGAIAVVDANGRVRASCGDAGSVAFLRSAAKPFQVLPLVESGGLEAFGITDQELAIMCASHTGTDEHVAVVSGLQAKIGIREEDLLCGNQMPEDGPTLRAFLRQGREPSPNRNECSGKHTAMLAMLRHGKLPAANYLSAQHGLQQTILQTVAAMSDLAPEQIVTGIDGCSAPTFAMPLERAALAIARLCDPRHFAAPRHAACKRIAAAMMSHPNMIAGPGRFDTDLMRVATGLILCKGGSGGYQVMGLMPGVLGSDSPGVGIAFKILDGDGENRVRSLVAVEILRQLGALSREQFLSLAQYDARANHNWRGLEVGSNRPCFVLNGRS